MPASPHATFTSDDFADLEARGVSRDEAVRQLTLLRRPRRFVRLERPCAPGDGIERLDDAAIDRALVAHDLAARGARCSMFVPASGAATRMFKELLAWLEAGEDGPEALAAAIAAGRDDALALRTFLEALDRFAFHDALAATVRARGRDLGRLRRDGPFRPVLEALLAEDGLGLATLPKGLIAFHRDGDEVRTAFEEHLHEAAGVVRDAAGECRLHFTVSPEHEPGFRSDLERVRARDEEGLGTRWTVEFSHQSPASDTLALGPAGEPLRGPDGHLMLRPAGHGALLGNLAASGADLALLKNIDNVASRPFKGPTFLWGRVLLGHLAQLTAAGHDRPVRVCGMVRNLGEPGGGPFWTRDEDGRVTLQIVESAEVDPDDPAQRALFERATHFNPVFLAVALRDARGRPWEVARFADERAAIVTRKSSGGRELTALERPGLWNGSMAHWETQFVEVPVEVFNPVKTVLDLLRAEHQPQ